MAEKNEQVATRVAEMLDQNRELSSRELFDAAAELDPQIEGEGIRRFHARYVLPVKRRQAVAEGRVRKRRARKKSTEAAPAAAEAEAPRRRSRRNDEAAKTAERVRVRGVLLQFAREFSEAESRAEIVSVLTDVDRYVDQIIEQE